MKKSFLLFVVFAVLTSFSNAQGEWNIIHPDIPHSDYKDVFFVSKDKGWIVGTKGLILFTDDGGDSWQLQYSNKDESFRSVCFVNENIGWTVGWSEIYHTNDGGKNWEKQNRPLAAYGDMTDVYFINEDTGWIVGDYKLVLKTFDGGQNWDRISNQYNGKYRHLSVDFYDYLHGCAVGVKSFSYKGFVMTTVDGGEHWSEMPVDSTKKLKSVCYLDSLTLLACGNDGELQRSSDGGNTWSQPESDYGTFNDLELFDDTNVFMLEYDYLKYSSDRGMTWETTSLPASFSDQYAISLADDTTFYTVGYNAGIYKSVDAGVSWEKLSGGSYPPILQIGFFNPLDGYAISGYANDVVLLHTNNGGYSWVNDSLIENGPFYMLRINDQSGYILNDVPQLLKTIHSGKDWTHYAIPDIGLRYNDLQFVNENTAYLCSDESNFYKTVDGGQNWNAIIFDTEYDFSFLYFFDENRGWTVDKIENKILRTTDGGNSWTITNLMLDDMVLEPTSIFFKDENNGFIATTIGDIYKTEDGGSNWTRYYSFQTGENSEIWFTTPTEGWYFGGRSVYHTFDGGETWTNEQSLREPLCDMFFLNKDIGWIGGRRGLVATCNLTVGFVENPQENASVLLFPNPADDQFEIIIPNKPENILALTIYNSAGQVVRSLSGLHGSNLVEVDVSELTGGLYFVEVETNSGRHLARFVKK